jgi:hypothetical protein
MTVQLELWQLITLLIAFFAAVGIAARMFLSQMNKGLDDRFDAQEKATTTANQTIHDALNRHMAEEGKALQQMQRLERDFLRWQAELPMQYVRREDYIRNQTIIEAKLDGLGLQLTNIQLKGSRHD